MAGILTDAHFNPLDLDDLLEDAHETGGLAAVVALLADAVADPRATGDPGLIGYLDELTEYYAELERYPAAIATAERIIDLDPGAADEERLWIAELHARAGHHTTARELLDQVRAAQQAQPPAERDPLAALSAAQLLGDLLGDRAQAVDWLTADQAAFEQVGVEPDLLRALDHHRRRIAAEATPPILLPAAAPAPTDPTPRPFRPRGQVRMGYLPPAEFAKAIEQGLLQPADTTHVDHRREVETALRQTPPGSERVVPITVDGLVAFAKEHDLDPAGGYARLRYAEDLAEPGILWPPDRNDTCWCGSGLKYKKCCRLL